MGKGADMPRIQMSRCREHAKRAFSMFLSVVLVVGLFPHVSFAAENGSGAQPAGAALASEASPDADHSDGGGVV